MSNPTISLFGKIGQDPVALGNGGLRLRVATNDRVKDDSTGEWRDGPTSWWTVKVWNRLAEQSKEVLKKGQEIVITGIIYEETWKDKETGQTKNGCEIRATSIGVTPWSVIRDKVSTGASWDVNSEVPF
jgi:single stranded DNA-binding protein